MNHVLPLSEWLGAVVDHCVVKRGIAEVLEVCLEAMNTGLTAKLIVGVDKLFGGTKQAVA